MGESLLPSCGLQLLGLRESCPDLLPFNISFALRMAGEMMHDGALDIEPGRRKSQPPSLA